MKNTMLESLYENTRMNFPLTKIIRSNNHRRNRQYTKTTETYNTILRFGGVALLHES